MSDKIIHLDDYRERSTIDKLKEDLVIEIKQLEENGFDMRDKYVIFDTSGLLQQEFNKEDVIGSLLFCSNVLLKLGQESVARDVSNAITRLQNNYYNEEK